MMRDVVKDRVSNRVHDVVQEALLAGVSPEEFREMVVTSWKYACADAATYAAKVFKR